MNTRTLGPHRSLVLAISLALVATSTQAATITVNSADDDAASTFCNLRNALASINNGATNSTCTGSVSGGAYGNNDTILFAANLASATITLTQGELGIIGSSATISGSGQTINAVGASRVFVVEDVGVAAASSLTFTGGHSATYGGGIEVGSGSALTLTNCTVSNSSAGSFGGGLSANGATVILSGSTVSGNSAGSSGGGIYVKDSTATLTNTIVATNTATTIGGGVYAAGGTLMLGTSTVSTNTATGKAGGLWSANGNTLAVDHSTVSGNSGFRSGGVYVAYQSTATLSSSTISGNTGNCATSDYCAGGIYVYASSLNVIDSTLAGNVAQAHNNNFAAGGAYLYNSDGTFTNSTITGNTAMGNAYLAGGLWERHAATASGSLTLVNATVASNTATSYNSGAYLAGGVAAGINVPPSTADAGTLTLANTIASSNVPSNSNVLIGAGTTTLSTAYSLLGLAENVSPFNDAANYNVFSDTPGLGPLQNNGGPTQIMALMPASPALRAGSASLAVYSGQPLYYDQRGSNYPRTFSGTVDIGAFENQGDRIFASSLESVP